MFEGLFQPMHLLVLAIIAMLVFGPKRFADLGKGLGDGIRQFKGAMKESDQQAVEKKRSPETTVDASSTHTTS